MTDIGTRTGIQKIVAEIACRESIYEHIKDMQKRELLMNTFFIYIDDICDVITDYCTRNFEFPSSQWIWENIFYGIKPDLENYDNGRQPELGDISLII